MIQLRITLPDRLAKQLEENQLEESELIAQALDKFFMNGPCHDSIQWKTLVENKLIDLQNQIDAHRSSGGKHDTVLDSNATRRANGTQDPLELTTSSDVRITTPSMRQPVKKIESSLNDLEIPL